MVATDNVKVTVWESFCATTTEKHPLIYKKTNQSTLLFEILYIVRQSCRAKNDGSSFTPT